MKLFARDLLEDSPTKEIKNYFLSPYETHLESSFSEEEEIISVFSSGPNCFPK